MELTFPVVGFRFQNFGIRPKDNVVYSNSFRQIFLLFTSILSPWATFEILFGVLSNVIGAQSFKYTFK